jgi:hypothetical protein
MAFRRLKQTISMYKSEGAITFGMAQQLLAAATEDVDEITTELKDTLSKVKDGVTIEFSNEGSIMDFVTGKTKVCPIKARLVIDDKK